MRQVAERAGSEIQEISERGGQGKPSTDEASLIVSDAIKTLSVP
jgi:hypothetical protein